MKSESNKDNKENSLIVRVDGQEELYQPPLYQVYVHNDDFTPMEFVVDILERIFYLNRRNATEVVLEAHLRGKAVCGVFTKDVAETKIAEVIDCARQNEQPLLCSMEGT